MISLQDIRDRRGALSLDEFVAAANSLLPQFLPEEVADSRVKGEVSIRLIRYFSTMELVDEPFKVGREARYTYRHLLQLLVVRRLMAMGHVTATVKKMTERLDDAQLEALLQGDAQFAIETEPHGDFMMASSLAEVESADDGEDVVEDLEAMASPNPAVAFLQNIQQGDQQGKRSSRSLPSSHSPAHRSTPVRPAPAQRWTRHEIAPGLEVHVREDYDLPPSRFERERLMETVLDELKLHRKRRR